VRSPTLRAAVAIGLVSGWMTALFAGFAAGGAVHLALVAALLLFPWRLLREHSEGD
jgi:hypothetical protein